MFCPMMKCCFYVLDGISNLRMGMYQQQMVPIKEMTDVLR